MSQSASQSLSLPDDQQFQSGTTSPGGKEEIRWITVARTAGLAPAQIIAGRLHAHDIPARVWQEAAGQAIGLTVGLLGNGHVAVPAHFQEAAERLLAEPGEDLADSDEFTE